MMGMRELLDRPPESYGRFAWAARTVVRNAQWVRTQGVAQLVEEHDLHPVRHCASAANRVRWRRLYGAERGEAIAVFLGGVPRCGTNMVVRGFAVSPQFEVHNEGDRAAFHRYRLRPDPVVREIVLRSRHRFVLFKPLLDSHRIPALLDDLGTPTTPRALWVFRDVDGQVRSALKKFGLADTTALRDIAAGAGGRRWQAQGLSEDSLELLCSTDWSRVTPADGAALFWYVRSRMYFELGLDQRPDVLPLCYETLVRAPTETMAAVSRFLGVDFVPQMAAGVDQRSLAVSQPLQLDARIRARCHVLAAELNTAADAALARTAVPAP